MNDTVLVFTRSLCYLLTESQQGFMAFCLISSFVEIFISPHHLYKEKKNQSTFPLFKQISVALHVQTF